MDGQGIAWRVILSFAPLMSAMYAAFTGISDNRNFLDDALCGALLGSMVGSIFYCVYFPSIFNITNSGRAYPPRRVGFSFLLGPFANFLSLDETPNRPLLKWLPDDPNREIRKKDCQQAFDNSSKCIIHKCHHNCVDPSKCGKQECLHKCGDSAKCISHDCHRTCTDSPTWVNQECHRHCIDQLECVCEIWKYHVARKDQSTTDCHHRCGDPVKCLSHECHLTCSDPSRCINHECHSHCIHPLRCAREMSKKRHSCNHSCGDAKCVSKECPRTCADSSKCVNDECHRRCIDPLKCVREIWKYHASMRQHSMLPVHISPQAHASHRYSQKMHQLSSPRQSHKSRSSNFDKKVREHSSIVVAQEYPGALKPDLISFSAPNSPTIEARERSLTNKYGDLKNLLLNNRYEETNNLTVTDCFEETQERTLKNRYGDSLTTVE